jgi:hypothetical protein
MALERPADAAPHTAVIGGFGAMTPIAAALASLSLLVAAAPAMAGGRMGGGGHGGGGHFGGGQAGGGHFGGGQVGGGQIGGGHFDGGHLAGGFRGPGPIGGFVGRPGRFGPRDGHAVWPYGWASLGYNYPWYADSYYYGDGQYAARAPEPTPVAAPFPPRTRQHDPNACAEWSWANAKLGYVCTRHAS